MKYLFELTILILFTLTVSEFNTTQMTRKRKSYSDLSDDYDSLDEKMDDIFSIKVKEKNL